MIPILYPYTETAFTGLGLGGLTEALRCEVTEERNGVYELELDYPASGYFFSELDLGCLILATHDDSGDRQPFEIYKRTAEINGVVTFYAHHISYRLTKIAVNPFSGTSCADAFSKISTNCMVVNPFTFTTDKTVATAYNLTVPRSVRSLLGGAEGSLLDVYGKGDYLFDKFNVSYLKDRGQDRGVTIRYGEYMTDLEVELDTSDLFDAVAPYWEKEGTVVTLPEGYVSDSGDPTIKVLDCSDKWDTAPSEAELRAYAQAYLAASGGMTPETTVTVSFIPPQQTAEGAASSKVMTVRLCDTVHIEHTGMGLTATAKVVKTDWDVLAERYNEIELGKPQATLADVILEEVNK